IAMSSSGQSSVLEMLGQVGTYTITVASGSIQGAAPPLLVTPGPAVKLAFGVQPANTPTGHSLPAVSVQVVDLFNNVVTGDNTDAVTLTVASGPGSWTASSTLSATVNRGVATFSNLMLAVPGLYTLGASVPGKYTG